MNPELLPLPKFALKKKFVLNNGDVSLDVAAPGAAELLTALRAQNAPIPSGDIKLGHVNAAASGGTKVAFGGGQGTVEFSGKADVAFGLGVYAEASEALKAAAPAPELADGLTLDHPAATRFLVLNASYSASGSAKGSLALGTGVNITFGA